MVTLRDYFDKKIDEKDESKFTAFQYFVNEIKKGILNTHDGNHGLLPEVQQSLDNFFTEQKENINKMLVDPDKIYSSHSQSNQDIVSKMANVTISGLEKSCYIKTPYLPHESYKKTIKDLDISNLSDYLNLGILNNKTNNTNKARRFDDIKTELEAYLKNYDNQHLSKDTETELLKSIPMTAQLAEALEKELTTIEKIEEKHEHLNSIKKIIENSREDQIAFNKITKCLNGLAIQLLNESSQTKQRSKISSAKLVQRFTEFVLLVAGQDTAFSI